MTRLTPLPPGTVITRCPPGAAYGPIAPDEALQPLGKAAKRLRRKKARGRKSKKERLTLAGRPYSREYLAYMKHPRWAVVRARVLARDERICQGADCGARASSVHHIHYRTLRHETGLELVSLCESCHGREHAAGLREREFAWRGLARIDGLPLHDPEEVG